MLLRSKADKVFFRWQFLFLYSQHVFGRYLLQYHSCILEQTLTLYTVGLY